MIKKTAWFLFFVLVGASCLDEPECFSLNNNLVGISFRKVSDSASDTVFLHSISAAETDSIFQLETILTGVDLPLNFFEDKTTYYFDGLNGRDSIVLGYSSRAQFVSEDCGERFVLDGLRVLSHSFDSVRIFNSTPKPNLTTGTNVQIFSCPDLTQVTLRFDTAVSIESVTTDYPVKLAFNLDTPTILNIPLNPAGSSSNIQLLFADGTSDTITITHAQTVQKYFDVCGEQVVLFDFNVTSSTFANAVVNTDSTQIPPHTRIEITL
jgi:hypothetical protein